MEVVIRDDAALVAAAVISALVKKKPDAVLGLATGKTQHAVYAALRAVDFSRVTTFNLDEYVGKTTFRDEMNEHFFRHVQVKKRHIPDGLASDIAQMCADYEAAIEAAGGIDLQLLGLGENGHIAFNEPTSSLASRTRIKTLMPPLSGHVVTMGIATILEARRIVLVALGAHKADAVAAMVEGPLSAMCPASALQMHPHVTVFLDEAAATRLKLREEYKAIERHKPAWQRA